MGCGKGFDVDVIIQDAGEAAQLQTITEFTDPEYGNMIDTSGSGTAIYVAFEHIRTEERQMFPGELQTLAMRAYVRGNLTINIGDWLVRYPGTGNETKYDIKIIKNWNSYYELELGEVNE